LSKRKKIIEFIRQNQKRSTAELAAQTGYDERQVAEILDQLKKQPGDSGFTSNVTTLNRRTIWFCALFLVLAVGLFYSPVSKNEFVNWDDRETITENIQIRHLDLQSLQWMFTTFHSGNWIPLTWLSLALDYRLGGLNPKVYHLGNLLFHVLNTWLVFLVCLRILRLGGNKPGTGKEESFFMTAALMAALLFGLHPIHVESVAWATERKDVLYAFFYLGGVLLYLDYASRPEKTALKLWGCLGLFGLALMSKPMAVTLPLVLLILDYWPLRRFPEGFAKAVVEKTPFFIFALAAGILAVASHEKTISSAAGASAAFWGLNAFRSLVFYAGKMIAPLDLSPLYPFPRVVDNLYKTQNLLAVLLTAAAAVLSLRYRRQKPYLAAAFLYYLAALAPVLGFLQVGNQAAADRYTYLPSLGVFLPLSAGITLFFPERRIFRALLIAVLTVALGLATVKQLGVWRDSITLWETVVRLYPGDSAMAHTYLGGSYTEKRRLDDALREFGVATAIRPPLASSYHGLGLALLYKGNTEEAVKAFRSALAADPSYPEAYQSLWKVYERLGRHEDAARQMREAIDKTQETPGNYTNLGVSYCFLKKYREAEEAFQKAYALEPAQSRNLVNLATVLLWQGRPQEALDLYRKGISQNPREPVYFLRMADIYLDQKAPERALEMLQAAWSLDPRDAQVAREIGEDYERAGRKDLAQTCFEKAAALAAEAVGSSPR
jgi:protein O-mannosyl-transferase